MNEIEEFYSYIEMPQVAENMKSWEGSFHDGMSLPPIPLDFRLIDSRGVDQGSVVQKTLARRISSRKSRAS